MITLTLYSRSECHLCDDMKALVHDAMTALGSDKFELRITDVSQSEDLEARYGERIPVLAIDGEDAFEVRVRPEALQTRLQRELTSRS